MKVDDNWRETKVTLEDMESLLGIPSRVSEEYLKILENLLVHRFLEEMLSCEEDQASYQVDLPYLGSLVIHKKGTKLSTDFAPSSSFYRKLKKAANSQESPLVRQCAKLLGQDLAEIFTEEGSIYD